MRYAIRCVRNLIKSRVSAHSSESMKPAWWVKVLTATIHLHSTPYSVYNIRTIVILEWDVLPWRLPNMPILRYEWRIRAAWNPIGRHC